MKNTMFFVEIDEFGEASKFELGFNEYNKCQTLEYKISWASSGDSNNFGNTHTSFAVMDLPEGKFKIKKTSPKKVKLVRIS